MTVIKIFAYGFFLTISSSTIGQKNCAYKIDTSKILLNENLDSFLTKLKDNTFQISKDKKDIPLFIKQQLECLAHNFSIANPNEQYNSTDVFTEGLPSRQLLFLGTSEDVFAMTYLLGGFGTSAHIIFIKFKDDQIVDLWAGVSQQDLKSIHQILIYIKQHRDKHWGLNTNFIYF
jgi:hypothetical protein